MSSLINYDSIFFFYELRETLPLRNDILINIFFIFLPRTNGLTGKVWLELNGVLT